MYLNTSIKSAGRQHTLLRRAPRDLIPSSCCSLAEPSIPRGRAAKQVGRAGAACRAKIRRLRRARFRAAARQLVDGLLRRQVPQQRLVVPRATRE